MENNKKGSFLTFLVMIGILAIFSGCIDKSTTMSTPTITSIPTATPTPTLTATISHTKTPIVNTTPIPSTTAIPTTVSTIGASTNSKTLSVGETWNIGAGYSLTAYSIDAKSTPKVVWIFLFKDGNRIDDHVLKLGDMYRFGRGSIFFETKIADIYAGPITDMVTFTDTYYT